MYTPTTLNDALCVHSLYTSFEARYGSDYSVSGEYHDFWEIVIVTDGAIGATAGKDVYHLTRSQAIIHEPSEFHNLWSERGSNPHIIIFSFGADNMPKISSRILEIPNLTEPKKILSQIRAAFDCDGNVVKGVLPEHHRDAQIAVKSLELFLLRALGTSERPWRADSSTSAKNYAMIVHCLENNIDKPLSISDIARMCNMGEANLKKTFSRYAGIGVNAYFNRLKISAAIPMLKDGMSVCEVSGALGYANQNYFCTVFKRVMGKSPKNFR